MEISKKSKILINFGAVALVLLFATLLAIFTDVRYAVNDDRAILRSALDFQPGGASTFQIYVNPLIAYPLGILGKFFPFVAWFSVFQITFLAISFFIIFKCIMQCTKYAGYSLCTGLGIAIGFFILFGIYPSCRITYSTTASILGAAAVIKMLTVSYCNPKMAYIKKSFLGSALLFILAYALRNEAGMVALAFGGLIIIQICLDNKNNRSLLSFTIITALITVCILVALYFWHKYEIKWRGLTELMHWNLERTNLTDFSNFFSLPKEYINSLGLLPEEFGMLTSWYQLDSNFSASLFNTITTSEEIARLAPSINKVILVFINNTKYYIYVLIALAIIGSLLFVSQCRKKVYKRSTIFLGIATVLLVGAFCFYLAYRRRLIERSVFTAIFPMACILFAILPFCLPKGKIIKSFIIFCLLGLSVVAIIPTLQNIDYTSQQNHIEFYEELDTQAVNNSDYLLIHSPDIIDDFRLFPKLHPWTPHNLVMWGGWERYTPHYKAKFEAFGIDSDNFQAKDWLNEDVRYLTKSDKVHPALLAYLKARVNENVVSEQEMIYDHLFAYSFYIEE